MLELLLGREKKLKITKKLQNTKSKNTVKTPVEEIYFFIMPSGEQFPVFFYETLYERKTKNSQKKLQKYKIRKYC